MAKIKRNIIFIICLIIGIVIGVILRSLYPVKVVEKPQHTIVEPVEYVEVICTEKTTTNSDPYNNIYTDYVNFTFDVINKSEKPIKGIEGILIVKDLFGKEIKRIECDFTGQTIAANSKVKFNDLSAQCFPQIDVNDSKMFNTDFDDLQFSYDVSQIVFEDGTTINL